MRRPHYDTTVLSVLSYHLKHFRREILTLVAAEPVLHLIYEADHTLDTVFVVDKLFPVVKLIILQSIAQIRETLAFGVFLLPHQGLLYHGNRFAPPLPACEDDTALMTEKLRIFTEQVTFRCKNV